MGLPVSPAGDLGSALPAAALGASVSPGDIGLLLSDLGVLSTAWILEAPWIFVAAFLLGSIPFALLLGFSRGIDLRKVGSGNVGATNLGRSAGIAWGVVAFLLDAAKGALPVAFVVTAGFSTGWGSGAEGTGDERTAVLAGGAAVLGHCFSPFLRFRGGKGVATMAGVLLGLAPLVFVALFSFWGVLVAWKRNIGLASVVTSVAAIGFGVFAAFGAEGEPRPWLAGLLTILPAVVIVRHRSNIRALLAARGGSR